MTKSELIEKLTVDSNELNKREAELIVNSIFDSIGQALIDGDRVEIRGFGSFTVRERDAREARNPKSGDIVIITAGHHQLSGGTDMIRVVKL